MTAAEPTDIQVVVFDIDGTLLDSATGIIAGFGVRSPPVGAGAGRGVTAGPSRTATSRLPGAVGVTADRIDVAAQAYHDYYLTEGLQQATAYTGVEALLRRLRAGGLRLATASAKRTTTAQAIITEHGLAQYFEVIAGTDEQRLTKAETLTGVLTDLAADPARTIMVGDRQHDVVGAHACDVRAVGARWGYGVDDELARAGADWLADDPATVGRLLGV